MTASVILTSVSAQVQQPQEAQVVDRKQLPAADAIANYWLTHATEATAKQTLFLQGLRESGTVLHAAEFAGINRITAYQWRKVFPEFAQAWDDALEDPIDRVEKTLYTMAVSGNNVTATMSYLRHNRAKYREETRIIVSKDDIDAAIELAVMEHQLPMIETLAMESSGDNTSQSSSLDHVAGRPTDQPTPTSE